MLKKLLIHLVTAVSAVVIVVSIWGIIYSILLTTTDKDKHPEENIKISTKTEEKTKVKSNSYNILVMGDSLAKGTGDETNKGFAGYFADKLKEKVSEPVNVNNIAVNGEISSGLLEITQSGNAIDLIKNSNMVLISIGGNEIKQFKNYNLASEPTQVSNVESMYISNLKKIFSIIRSKNQNCRIIFIGLYNPFGDEITPDKLAFLNKWNYDTESVVHEDAKGTFVPTYDLFQYNTNSYLTIDNFHPNSKGYKAIAERMIEDFS